MLVFLPPGKVSKNGDLAAGENSLFFDYESFWKIAIYGLPWGGTFPGFKWSISIEANWIELHWIEMSWIEVKLNWTELNGGWVEIEFTWNRIESEIKVNLNWFAIEAIWVNIEMNWIRSHWNEIELVLNWNWKEYTVSFWNWIE